MNSKLIKMMFAFFVTLMLAVSPRLDTLSGELDSLEKADSKNAVSKDIVMARSFIRQARQADAAAQEKFHKRVEHALELVRALVAAAKLSDTADDQETAAFSSPEKLKNLKQKVEALSKRRDALKKTIKELEKK